ncbi:MAG: tRNA lysidine(34) synthetase TilS [Spongiibacter sp.]|uniref:tRNA lysidine(34) synthetase TilS n=1 Tax=Spongiibacter sp. TaxID=2024860 RepID=UPI001B225D31|nr:tRNA lysidine(34) synthetase TilS [Spongiibacter sp.]MBO6754315.1 tRNA lysidine(34) synthetase TilS [Spongiibacter sp.]
MADGATLIAQLEQSLRDILPVPRLWLAFSGGMDSRVLLSLLMELREQCSDFPPLSLIHVDHGLQADSGVWAQHCLAVAETLGLPCVIKRVVVSPQAGGQGPEAEARLARYRVFESLLGRGELLLQAHHLDDQCETLMLRLLRGAGLNGLAAMPRGRVLGQGRLLRPLLTTQRSQLQVYAQARNLKWLEDPSNQDARYDRNYLRHRVMPAMAERWSSDRQALSRAAENLRDSQALLNDYLDADLEPLLDGKALSLGPLGDLAEYRQLALLRRYLERCWGVVLSRPQLEDFAGQFLTADVDAVPEVCVDGWRFYRFARQLIAEPETLAQEGLPAVQSWGVDMPLELPQGRLSAAPGGSFAPRGRVEVAFRQGGERCQLAGETHSRALKKLLQAWQLAPRRRERLPLIYCDGQLAAIADLAICEGYLAQPGEQGVALHWQDAADR